MGPMGPMNSAERVRAKKQQSKLARLAKKGRARARLEKQGKLDIKYADNVSCTCCS